MTALDVLTPAQEADKQWADFQLRRMGEWAMTHDPDMVLAPTLEQAAVWINDAATAARGVRFLQHQSTFHAQTRSVPQVEQQHGAGSVEGVRHA